MEIAMVNIMVPQGGEYEETFTFYDDEAKTAPKDLGVKGWIGRIVMRDKKMEMPPYVSEEIDTSEADVGKIGVMIPAAVTAAMRTLNHEEDVLAPMENYVYAVICENGDRKKWILRGELAVIPDPSNPVR